mgnify:CR=1 FL=1
MPSLSSLHRIAVALDTNVSWFFSVDGDQEQIVMRNGERPAIRSKSERAIIGPSPVLRLSRSASRMGRMILPGITRF